MLHTILLVSVLFCDDIINFKGVMWSIYYIFKDWFNGNGAGDVTLKYMRNIGLWLTIWNKNNNARIPCDVYYIL